MTKQERERLSLLTEQVKHLSQIMADDAIGKGGRLEILATVIAEKAAEADELAGKDA